MEFDICSLELEHVSWSHVRSHVNWLVDPKILKVILIGDSTALLDYGHQFMGSLHVVDSKSKNWALSHCYLHRVLSVVDSL